MCTCTVCACVQSTFCACNTCTRFPSLYSIDSHHWRQPPINPYDLNRSSISRNWHHSSGWHSHQPSPQQYPHSYSPLDPRLPPCRYRRPPLLPGYPQFGPPPPPPARISPPSAHPRSAQKYSLARSIAPVTSPEPPESPLSINPSGKSPKRSLCEKPLPVESSVQSPCKKCIPSTEPPSEKCATPKTTETRTLSAACKKGVSSVTAGLDLGKKQVSTKSTRPKPSKSILKRIPPPPPPYPPPTTPVPPPPPPSTPPPACEALPISIPFASLPQRKTHPSSDCNCRSSDCEGVTNNPQTSESPSKEREKTCTVGGKEVSNAPALNTSCYLSLSSVLDDLRLSGTADSCCNNSNFKKASTTSAGEKNKQSALPEGKRSLKTSSKCAATDSQSHLSNTNMISLSAPEESLCAVTMPRRKNKSTFTSTCSKGNEDKTKNVEVRAASLTPQSNLDASKRVAFATGSKQNQSTCGVAMPQLGPQHKQPESSKLPAAVSTNELVNQCGTATQSGPESRTSKCNKNGIPKAKTKVKTGRQRGRPRKNKHDQPSKAKKKKVIIPGSPCFIPPERTKARSTIATKLTCRESISQPPPVTGAQSGSAPLYVSSLMTTQSSTTSSGTPLLDQSATTKSVAVQTPRPVLAVVLSASQSQSIVSSKSDISTTTASSVKAKASPSLMLPTISAAFSVPTSCGIRKTGCTSTMSSICSTTAQTSSELSGTTATSGAQDSTIRSEVEDGPYLDPLPMELELDPDDDSTPSSLSPTYMSSTCTSVCVDPVPAEVHVDAVTKGEVSRPCSSGNIDTESSDRSLSKLGSSKTAPSETVSVHNTPLATILPLSVGAREYSLPRTVSPTVGKKSSTGRRGVAISKEPGVQLQVKVTSQSVVSRSVARNSDTLESLSEQCSRTIEKSIDSFQCNVSSGAKKPKQIPMPLVSSCSGIPKKRRVPARRKVSELLLSDDEGTAGESPKPSSSAGLSFNANAASLYSSPVYTSPVLSTNTNSSLSCANNSRGAPLVRVISPVLSPVCITSIASLAVPSSLRSSCLASTSTTACTSTYTAPHTALVSSCSVPSTPLVQSSISSSNLASSTSLPSSPLASSSTTMPSTSRPVSTTTTAALTSDSSVTVFTTEASTGQTLKVTSAVSMYVFSTFV